MVTYLQKDDSIVQLLKSKNRQAIADIYDKYGGTLYGIILRMVKSEKTAEEVLEKTLLQVWQNAHQYDASQERLFSWIFHICQEISLHALQSQQNQPIANVEKLIHSSALKRVVQGLDEQYQEIIDLVYLQGYTTQQVVETLNLPLETVKERIRLATQQLRKVIHAC